jgi:C1A family cysteine protease
MKEGGINASEGANALKSGLAALINPTKKASEMLANFGINAKEIVVKNKGDLKATVIEFATALNQLDPLNRAQAIEQMFGKFQFARLSTLFANVAKDGNQAARVLSLANSSVQELSDLSEQELVDCATGVKYGSHGCSGGQMEGAFKYVIEKGQCSLDSYPYTSSEGSCHKCSTVVRISSCSDVKSNDQISLRVAVSRQPVAVAISADTKLFQSYSSGVITSPSCYTSLDHGVLIVGYGTENGQDYWLVKNSWGESWGSEGYVKIARSSSKNDPGVCGIALQPSFPSV